MFYYNKALQNSVKTEKSEMEVNILQNQHPLVLVQVYMIYFIVVATIYVSGFDD